MSNITDITLNLQTALQEAAEAEKKYSEALANIQPLEVSAIEKRRNVASLMAEYQGFMKPFETPTKKRGRHGAKRPPRTLTAIVSTTATRMLKTLHQEGKPKKQSLNVALDRAEVLSQKKGEPITQSIKDMIVGKAEEIWKK